MKFVKKRKLNRHLFVSAVHSEMEDIVLFLLQNSDTMQLVCWFLVLHSQVAKQDVVFSLTKLRWSQSTVLLG